MLCSRACSPSADTFADTFTPATSALWRTKVDGGSGAPKSPERQQPSANTTLPSLKTAVAAKPPGVRIPLPPPIAPLSTGI
jgi:hypothetical protein